MISHEMGKCSQCFECINTCPGKALSIVEGVFVYSEDACYLCETCMDVCDSQAIRVIV